MSKVTMYLEGVVCCHTSESGHDEVYVTYSIDGGNSTRYPSSGYTSMSPSDTNLWKPDLELQFNSTVLVKLWDYDSTSGDDELGSFTYQLGDQEGTLSTIVTEDNGARYVLVTGPTL